MQERYLAAEALFNRACNAQKQGDMHASINLLKQTLHTNSRHGPAHYCLAVALEQAQQPEEARKHYHDTLDIIPSHAGALKALARLYASTHPRKALHYLQLLDKHGHCDHANHLQLAMLLEDHTNHAHLEDIESHLLSALALNPHDLRARVRLASLYEAKCEDFGAAHRQWRAVASVCLTQLQRTQFTDAHVVWTDACNARDATSNDNGDIGDVGEDAVESASGTACACARVCEDRVQEHSASDGEEGCAGVDQGAPEVTVMERDEKEGGADQHTDVSFHSLYHVRST